MIVLRYLKKILFALVAVILVPLAVNAESELQSLINEGTVKLEKDYLYSYSKDFVLQAAIDQHNDLALFNPTSVNTYVDVLKVCPCSPLFHPPKKIFGVDVGVSSPFTSPSIYKFADPHATI